MTDTLEIGVVGGGNVASVFHLPLLSLMSDVRINYIADRRDVGKLAAAYRVKAVRMSDDPSILPESDAVLLAIPVGVREPYFREFSERKIPLFAEKPFTTNLASHEIILSHCHIASCNYMRTFFSCTRQVKSLIEADLFGPVRRVSISEGGVVGSTGKEKDNFQTKAPLTGGRMMMDRGCHTLSQLDFIFANHKVRTTKAEIIFQDGLDVDVHAEISVEGKETCVVSYDVSLIRKFATIFTIDFEYARLSFNPRSPLPVIHVTGKNGHHRTFSIDTGDKFAETERQAFYLKWRAFIDALKGKRKLDAAEETSVNTTRLMDEIYSLGRLGQ